MKYILFFFLLSFNVKSQTLQQQINMLRQDIYLLKNKVDSLQNINNLCCCENKLNFIHIFGLYYFPEADPESLNLNDRLPLENVCNGQKAILITEDATIYAMWQDWNGGWTVYSHAHGGINQ